MFTENQINQINSKAKTGADYPQRVQELKEIGVIKYYFNVENGSDIYYDDQDLSITTKAKYENILIASVSSREKLLHTISIHQNGETDFPTFCKQAAEAGVEKWLSDLEKMQVIYYDKNATELVSEPIPVFKI